jgi:phage terminase small subunit
MTTQTTPTRPLNARQKEFCRLVIAGLPAAKAYRDSGYSPVGDNAGASRLLANVSIQLEIARLQAITVKAGVEIRSIVMDGLLDLADSADTDSARIRALELLGKTERMFVEVQETQVAHEVSELKEYSMDELRIMLAAANSEPIVTTARMIESGDGVTA